MSQSKHSSLMRFFPSFYFELKPWLKLTTHILTCETTDWLKIYESFFLFINSIYLFTVLSIVRTYFIWIHHIDGFIHWHLYFLLQQKSISINFNGKWIDNKVKQRKLKRDKYHHCWENSWRWMSNWPRNLYRLVWISSQFVRSRLIANF